jgi:aspartyl-tRNA(Asn)/glutamyl-tRNA(Gln) amidotransferase subunit B
MSTIALAPDILNSYEMVIGLEVHAQLLTKTKAFCGDSTTFGAEPNTNTSPLTLGHPGTLPVLNKEMVEFTIRMGLATNCSIRPVSMFARKHYFYPDLPKGYQISQYDDPICYDGHIVIEYETSAKETVMKRIGITRIHLEEDAGKSIHDLDLDTLVDLNRAGVPLIEIVSEPDIRSAQEAVAYLMQIRQILLYLGICDGNMEEGSLRCDVNLSVRKKGAEQYGTRAEVKNMNSFRNVEKAIQHEFVRQIGIVEVGEKVIQQTRMWDAGEGVTRPLRTKERAHDYRYFPEPDLPPVHVDSAWIERVRAGLPELALARKQRFIHEYGLPSYDAAILTVERDVAQYFEDCCHALAEHNKERFKLVSNWLMTEVLRILSERKISIAEFGVPPHAIAELVELFANDIINSKVAKDIFPDVIAGQSAKTIVEERGLAQVSDTGLIIEIVDRILAENQSEVEKYKSGRKNVFGFFVGKALALTKGKANPKVVTHLLQERLDASS